MVNPSNDDYQETQTNPLGFFSDTKSATACSVRVALRVRPLVGRELFESPNICTKCYQQENQLVIGKDRTFTFDKVFDIGTKQEDVFEVCVKNLVLGCFQGYNATVLAYGQTGSGKTHTMGSGYTIGIKDHELGIIPRVIRLIFDEVEKRKSKADITIKCAFLEIYNEELHDLLDHQPINGGGQTVNGIIDRFIQKKEISIREEKNGSISLFGLREDKVSCYEELAACLDRGSNVRTTASTLMNNCSSRSHAIFTISIEQSIIEDLYKADSGPNQAPVSNQGEQPEEYMVAKFHFVDLAGSERAKRTGATGNTLKEGISINKGLLALGNVIAALTEEGKKNHVPYRDSKLTRILQDSLGGNSRTSMIACVSPAEVNFEETLNTLKYASRARNIKNAPKVNRDPNSAQIAQLRQQVFDLMRELTSCKKILINHNIEFDQSSILPLDLASQGIRDSFSGPSRSNTEFMYGNQQIQKYEQEIKDLKTERTGKEKKISQLQAQIDAINDQSAQNQIEYFTVKKERDLARLNLEQIINILKKRNIYEEILSEIQDGSMDIDEGNKQDILIGKQGILEEYQVKVEEQKKEIADRVQQVKALQKDLELLMESSQQDIKNLEQKEQEIERLKRSVNKLQKENVQIKNEQRRGFSAGASQNITKSNLQPVLAQPPQNLNSFSQAAARKSAQEKRASQLKQISSPRSSLKPGALPLQDASNSQWLSSELDYNIQHFNEQFIENLSQSLSAMLVKKPAAKAESDQTPDKQDPDEVIKEVSGSDEDEPMDEEEHIVVPNDEKAQQEVIESNEEVKKEDLMLRAQLEHQEQQIVNLEDDLKMKENLLQTIKESHKSLSNNLLEAMKNEYHKKIAHFQQEMLLLEQERQEQMRKAENSQQKTKLEEQYKRKLKELEDKLGQAKQKEREQQTMQKQSSTQKQKIKTLESEIEKMKSQKVTLMKRIKEESEQHRKWKAERCKEIMQIKSSNQKKDREIQMLKRDNKKKELIAKRKQEELTALMKKSKTDKQKQINGKKDRMKKKNIDVQYLQSWIIQNTEKMLRYKELQSTLGVEVEQRRQVEQEIAEEQAQFAQISVRRDKLEFRKGQLDQMEEGYVNEEELYHINEELDQLNLELRQMQDNLDNLEEKHDFIENKITEINKAVIEFSPDDIDQLNFEEVQSIEGARACLGAFFGILLDVNVYKNQLEQSNYQSQATIEGLNSQLEELRQIQMANEITFQQQIEQLNQEYIQKEELLMKLIMENGGQEIESILSAFQQNPKLKLNDDLTTPKASSNTHHFGVKKNAKLEMQKQNQQIYNQSKTALSKRVAELERERKDEQKRLENIRHKLEQTNAEKEVIKRQLDTIKTKIKQQDIQDIKQSKVLPPATQEENANSMSGQKSPRFNSMANRDVQKMNTLKDMRNERKIKKLTGASSVQRIPTNETRVIADEPMEEQEEGEAQPVNELVKPPLRSNPNIEQEKLQQKTPEKQQQLQQQQQQQPPATGNVFQRLLQSVRLRSDKSSLIEQNVPTTNQSSSFIQQAQSEIPQSYEDDQNWKCQTNKEQAHNGQICAIASVGNQLYSTSNKSLRIWDLEDMKLISDISAHSGFIRCLTTWESKTLLVTASDKSIILWDMVSLTQVAQLKGHKEEIRALAVGGSNGNLLFSAGKGNQNGGSLLIWDLRKGSSPVEEKEKNQDVFSLALTSQHLFMGCRNHSVYPINLKTFETLPAFEPPHFDAVTSLAILSDDVLVSGSRDKNLRQWDSKSFSHGSAVLSAHSDWINTLETDHEKKMMYSGCKDGVVKVWKMKNKQLQCSAQLFIPGGQPNGNSINTISKIDKQFGVMFATGGSDRQIRIWRYNEVNGSPNNDDGVPQVVPFDDLDNYLQIDGRPDFEMVDEHPIRQDLLDDDMFEFESAPQKNYKQQHSLKVEEVKHDTFISTSSQQSMRVTGGRTFSRGKTNVVGQQVPVGGGTGPASKLELKRREKRLQEQAKRISSQKENDQF